METNDFVVTSYYTIETPYVEVCHDYLMPSVSRLNLNSDIRAIPNRGSWLKNTAYKPEFLRAMMDKHDENIVFVDVDAEIKFYPALFLDIPKEYYVAAHLLDKSAWYGNGYPKNTFELLSGTLWFRNCDQSRKLLDDWMTACRATNIWEQKVLHSVLDSHGIKYYQLPLSYCYIKSMPSGKPPVVKCDNPVIVHNQVSRSLKRVIG